VLPLSTGAVQNIFVQLASRAGILERFHLTPHTLRHFFATEFLSETGDLALTQYALGHFLEEIAKRAHLPSAPFVTMLPEVRIGYDDEIAATVGIVYVGICPVVVHPVLAVAQVTKLVSSPQLQVNRDRPVPLAIPLQGMRLPIPVIKVADKVDRIGPDAARQSEFYASHRPLLGLDKNLLDHRA
jgi:hypothetical protein